MKYIINCNLKDTHPDIDKRLQELYARLTHEERFNKMLSLCKTAREIITSQLPEGLSLLEKRKRLFEIYYSNDFSEEEFIKITKRIFHEQT